MPLLKPNVGRALSAIGALIVVLALFMTWYHIVRPDGSTDDTTGWQTFTNLRFVILAGAIVTIGTALVRQTRPVLIVRTILGIVLAVLILRRIIWPADVTGDVSTEIGVYVAFVGAVLVALGGLSTRAARSCRSTRGSGGRRPASSGAASACSIPATTRVGSGTIRKFWSFRGRPIHA